MDLFLDPEAKRTLTRDLFDQLVDGIVSGRLGNGDRLTPTREVAAQLGVSRHTVTTVYSRLAAEGFIEGRAGGGSFVTDVAAIATLRAGRRSTPERRSPSRSTARLETVDRSSDLPADDLPADADDPPTRFDLRPGTPDLALFPLVAWRRCMTTALQVLPPSYGDPAGLPALRRAIARWIGRSRAVEARPDQVIVTAGAQQAVDLVARLLLRRGDAAAIEEPGYPPVRRLLEACGAVVVPVPVDAQGILVERIPRRARLIYTTPSHQSPTGATMTLARRRALLALAARQGALIIEDDYDSEYRHVDRPLEPLHRLDASGGVVYVGTFSKTLSPSLRLGFLVLPDALVASATELRRLMDWQPPAATQVAMLRFIADGMLDRHLRRTRRIYSERHRIVREFVTARIDAGQLERLADNYAGLHITSLLGGGRAEEDVRAAALARGVAIGNFAECWMGADPPGGLTMGFGAVATADLPTALRLVGEVLARRRSSALVARR